MTSISLSTFRYDSDAGPGPSRYASVARLTCCASRSASEYTATDSIPSSSSARMTRTAISPRLATSTLVNIRARHAIRPPDPRPPRTVDPQRPGPPPRPGRPTALGRRTRRGGAPEARAAGLRGRPRRHERPPASRPDRRAARLSRRAPRAAPARDRRRRLGGPLALGLPARTGDGLARRTAQGARRRVLGRAAEPGGAGAGRADRNWRDLARGLPRRRRARRALARDRRRPAAGRGPRQRQRYDRPRERAAAARVLRLGAGAVSALTAPTFTASSARGPR